MAMLHAPLIGRTDELAELIDLVDVGRGVLVLRGEPGVGKTSLLNAAAEAAEASGRRVLRAGGVEYEAELPFAGLHQLLHPLADDFEQLAPGQRDALNQAFAVADGPTPGRMAISLAALSAIEQAARGQPIVVVIDDLQWLDACSVEVVSFVARRLQGAPVILLASTRDDSVQLGLPELRVAALGEAPATELLRTRFPGLSASTLRRLLDEACGNPLALVELPAALTKRQTSGSDPLPEALTLSLRLEGLFARRVRHLPPNTRFVLLLAAFTTESLDVVLQAADHDGDIDLFTPAVEARLATVERGRLMFRHPLVRSAVVQMASLGQRRVAHLALAGTPDASPERRAWHLAAAAVAPDEIVASALEDAAAIALRRGGAEIAITSLARAAELSPSATDQARRWAEAAFLANMSGQLERARALLADSRRANPDNSQSHFAVTSAYLMINLDGDLSGAHKLLVQALRTQAEWTEAATWVPDTMYMLLVTAYLSSDPSAWSDFDEAAARLAPASGMPLLSLSRDALGDPARTAHGMRERLLEAFSDLPDEGVPWQVTRLGSVCSHVDALDIARDRLRRVVDSERAGGAMDSLAIALSLLSQDAFTAGRWDDSEALALDGLAVVEAGGYRLIAGSLQYRIGLLAAARGHFDQAEQVSAELLAWSATHRIRLWESTAWHCRTLAALGRGNYAEAYASATRVSAAGVLQSHAPIAPWLVLDMVDAALRLGKRSEARAHLRAAEAADLAGVSPRMGLLAAGAAALVAPDASAAEHFSSALHEPNSAPWPFEQARIRLAFGEWLRRARSTVHAVEQLQTAMQTFESLGAAPWADRARNELRALGVSAANHARRNQPSITSQELTIAQLAAAGMSNKEIGQRLFLSPRTVGSHLYRLFPKLGITSRAALRDALARTTGERNEDSHGSS
jgi:DNA-binding CsgD family transcriptional regulator/nucleoside-triphosphatase THEP1